MKQGLNKINYAEVQVFELLKIKTSNTLEGIIDKLMSSNIVVSDKYIQNIENIFYTHIENLCLKQNSKKNETNIYLKITQLPEHKTITNDNIAKELINNIDIFANSISLRNDLIDEINKNIELFDREREQSINYYSKYYSDNLMNFPLLPVRVKLRNNEEHWMIPKLKIFTNKMMFMKFDIPISNVKSDALFDNNEVDYVEEYRVIDYHDVIIFESLNRLKEYYLTKISNSLTKCAVFRGNVFSNIILVDTNEMPRCIDNLSKEYKESLYFMLLSPFSGRSDFKYTKEIDNILNRQCYNLLNIHYYVKTTGKLITVTDKEFIEKCKKVYEINDCNKLIAKDLGQSSEFSIMIIMLEKMNNDLYFFERNHSKHQFKDIKLEYNNNIIFINNMIKGCMGTVIDQVSFFRDNLTHYLMSALSEANSNALDRMIEIEENERKSAFQNTVTIFGFILTVIFGLPAINQTLLIIKNTFYKDIDLIPSISTGQISVIIWAIVLTMAFIFLIKRDVDNCIAKVLQYIESQKGNWVIKK